MKKKVILIAVLSFILAALVIFLLFWNGVILLNNPSREEYPVRGVDVSSYQGEIDWPVLAQQDLSFAFIKATEGSSFTDPYFQKNYKEAQKTGLRIGAYHFFSYDSPGATQADNFIAAVEPIENMLPPVIDLEFYGDKEKNPPPREEVRTQLTDMVNRLKDHYGMDPIIYATEKSYSLYLDGEFQTCDIWIRNVISGPRLSDNRDWTFWQYTNRARLPGYQGEETYIDLNVFCGTSEEFARYGADG